MITDEITAEELRSRQHGPLSTDGDHEFRCPHCQARCTEHPTEGTEFGHRTRCPRRPDHLPYGAPQLDREIVHDVATDGGESP